MMAEDLNEEDPASVCAVSEAEFSLGEIRSISCERMMSGRIVRFTTFLTESQQLDLLELEVHGF